LYFIESRSTVVFTHSRMHSTRFHKAIVHIQVPRRLTGKVEQFAMESSLASTTKEPTDVSPAAPPSNERQALPIPEGCRQHRVIWSYWVSVVVLHLLLPLMFVPWLFSWTGLALVFLGNYFFCSLGIGAGYHRLLTHHGFRCSKRFEHFLALLGVCCLQDSPARWVLVHRLHHKHSDEQPDPHTPLVSWYWGHVGWLFIENRELSSADTYQKYVRDLLQDPFYMWIERGGRTYWIYLLQLPLFWSVGWLCGWVWYREPWGAVQFATSILYWGVIVRTVYTWHVTWGINSFSHLWGYQTYVTGDNSRNNWLFALATNGEGWHNNHHADPRSAQHGHRWWEIDITYRTLCVWERIGWITDLVRPQQEKIRLTNEANG
jgi:fatty-acid desaturase